MKYILILLLLSIFVPIQYAFSMNLNNDIISNGPMEIAEAIFNGDRDWFLAFSPSRLADHCQKPSKDNDVNGLFMRRNWLARVVQVSISQSDDPIEARAVWLRVANELFSLSDFFGYGAITEALSCPAFEYALQDQQWLRLKKNSLRVFLKKYNFGMEIIPDLAAECHYLACSFSHIEEIDEYIKEIFVENFYNTQKAVTCNMPSTSSGQKSQLAQIFSHSPQSDYDL